MNIDFLKNLFSPASRADAAEIADLQDQVNDLSKRVEDAELEAERVTALLGQAVNLVFTMGDVLKPFVGTLTMKGLTTDRTGVEFTGDPTIGIDVVVVPSVPMLRFLGGGVPDLEMLVPTLHMSEPQQTALLSFRKRVELEVDPVSATVSLIVVPRAA